MSTSIKPKRLLLIQEHLPHYRVAFFSQLRSRLQSEGIELDLVYGQRADSRMLTRPLEWAHPVPLIHLGPLIWHRLGRLTKGADLIIVPQEVKYLRCHLLHLKSRVMRTSFAYWGHGRNFQAPSRNSLPEILKAFLSRRVDWWFAYNDLSARIVRNLGFPTERITTVGNAIDTSGLMRRRQQVTEAELRALREKMGLQSEHVAVYTGGLYSTKRIPFLLDAARLIRKRTPDFHLLVIGDGPERPLVREAAARDPWIHYLGPLGDAEKVPYWALAKVLLMPGGVGLVILDSFALGVPMVTTETTLHGPEIDYLENGHNGLLVACEEDPARFSDAVQSLFVDHAYFERLRTGALASASRHSLEGMVDRFTSGVLQALDE